MTEKQYGELQRTLGEIIGMAITIEHPAGVGDALLMAAERIDAIITDIKKEGCCRCGNASE